MKLFYKLALAALPILLITLLYIYLDPFMVVHHYANLQTTQRKHLELNEDYASTEAYIANEKSHKYDSYTFGSSRAAVYNGPHLHKLLSSDDYYRFTVALETLYGVERKLDFLNKRGAKIKNVLLAIDAQLLSSTENSKGHLFRKHPATTGESYIDYQAANYIDIYNTEFIKSYAALLRRPKQVGKAVDNPYLHNDKLIAANRDSFYSARKKEFYTRTGKLEYNKTIIGVEQKKLLSNISKIFAAQGTNYIILIHPLYDQRKLSPDDMNILYNIFDKNRIYDFSGVNEYTESMYNYYEPTHYRIFIAEKVMDSIYSKQHQP